MIGAFAFAIGQGGREAAWARQYTAEGRPLLTQDARASKGYLRHPRELLATHERGETFRWVVEAQETSRLNLVAPRLPRSDNAPEGRPTTTPRLYALWLGGLASSISAIQNLAYPIAVEQVAVYEPLILRVLLLSGIVIFAWAWDGPQAAACCAVFFGCLPIFSAQFISGSLGPRTLSLALAGLAFAHCLRRRSKGLPFLGASPAAIVAISLWLDPTFGFPTLLLTAAVSALCIQPKDTLRPVIAWALTGTSLTLIACVIDHTPWALAVTELRSIHPTYGLVWLGLGALLLAKRMNAAQDRRITRFVMLGAGTLLLATWIHLQARNGYWSWLHYTAAQGRLSSWDETKAWTTLLDWVRTNPPSTIAMFLVPLGGTAVALTLAWRSKVEGARVMILLWLGVGLLSFFRLRWGVLWLGLSLPAVLALARRQGLIRSWVAPAFVSLCALLSLLEHGHSRQFDADAGSDRLDTSHVLGILERDFSYWLASHVDGQPVTLFAPPSLSDSVHFHVGIPVLLSSAWQTFPGQVAGSRILSSLESSEAEAVLANRHITHLAIPSWDPAFSQLERIPSGHQGETLLARLQRWIVPPFLRPIPYHLPDLAAFRDQKLAVFKVTEPQDEGLALSRLAEYFVEMGRTEPASLVNKVLDEKFTDDPNACIARALVAWHTKQSSTFEKEARRLESDIERDRLSQPWDRRVQRAIVLGMAKRHTLARAEISACWTALPDEQASELTPLQAHYFASMVLGYGLSKLDDPQLKRLQTISQEYASVPK